jgi:hypothetical protein
VNFARCLSYETLLFASTVTVCSGPDKPTEASFSSQHVLPCVFLPFQGAYPGVLASKPGIHFRKHEAGGRWT